jgi:16S rRNA (cytidine1402-2'-O)-methyltransferase
MEPARPPLTPGTLYLVATPIGNLEDITLRALRTLKECDVVAAEDTRHTGQLLHRLGIGRPMLSCHRFNEASRSEEILERLAQGQTVALVSDAGSPGISDPGERIVRAALSAGRRVESVPGPCALVAGLTASGLPTGEFHFVGFLPHKSGQRQRLLERLATLEATLVLYESPYRNEPWWSPANSPRSSKSTFAAIPPSCSSGPGAIRCGARWWSWWGRRNRATRRGPRRPCSAGFTRPSAGRDSNGTARPKPRERRTPGRARHPPGGWIAP